MYQDDFLSFIFQYISSKLCINLALFKSHMLRSCISTWFVLACLKIVTLIYSNSFKLSCLN